MPSPLVTVASDVVCPHGAAVVNVPSAQRVIAAGSPVITVADTTVIAGCPFAPGGAARPCGHVDWLVGTTRVWVGGQPAVIQGGTAIAISAQGSANGPVQVVQTQLRAVAT